MDVYSKFRRAAPAQTTQVPQVLQPDALVAVAAAVDSACSSPLPDLEPLTQSQRSAQSGSQRSTRGSDAVEVEMKQGSRRASVGAASSASHVHAQRTDVVVVDLATDSSGVSDDEAGETPTDILPTSQQLQRHESHTSHDPTNQASGLNRQLHKANSSHVELLAKNIMSTGGTTTVPLPRHHSSSNEPPSDNAPVVPARTFRTSSTRVLEVVPSPKPDGRTAPSLVRESSAPNVTTSEIGNPALAAYKSPLPDPLPPPRYDAPATESKELAEASLQSRRRSRGLNLHRTLGTECETQPPWVGKSPVVALSTSSSTASSTSSFTSVNQSTSSQALLSSLEAAAASTVSRSLAGRLNLNAYVDLPSEVGPRSVSHLRHPKASTGGKPLGRLPLELDQPPSLPTASCSSNDGDESLGKLGNNTGTQQTDSSFDPIDDNFSQWASRLAQPDENPASSTTSRSRTEEEDSDHHSWIMDVIGETSPRGSQSQLESKSAVAVQEGDHIDAFGEASSHVNEKAHHNELSSQPDGLFVDEEDEILMITGKVFGKRPREELRKSEASPGPLIESRDSYIRPSFATQDQTQNDLARIVAEDKRRNMSLEDLIPCSATDMMGPTPLSFPDPKADRGGSPLRMSAGLTQIAFQLDHANPFECLKLDAARTGTYGEIVRYFDMGELYTYLREYHHPDRHKR